MISFRHADPDDLAVVGELLYEVERFYGTEDFPPHEEWERQIAVTLFGEVPSAMVLLAVDDDAVLGFASYSFLWPAAGVSRSLFLKELYVRDRYRRRGVGLGLMSRLHAVALEAGSGRVEWQTDLQNNHAQMFYKRLGVTPLASKVTYRVDGDDITRISRLQQDEG